MLRVLIVDDEALAAERLTHLCGRLDGVEVVGTTAEGHAALSRIEALRPDLLLLDISMPGMDGMALARTLARRDDRPAVVFVTAHDHHAVEAFELAAVDYLLKPVSLARLNTAVARAAAIRPVCADAFLTEIWAPHGQEMVRVGVETLDLLEAERDYVRLHAGGRTFLVRMTFGELERRLDPSHFVRVHRSSIVPLSHIRAVRRTAAGDWAMVLATGATVRVGRSFRGVVKKMAGGLA